jgi:hypothetical protein
MGFESIPNTRKMEAARRAAADNNLDLDEMRIFEKALAQLNGEGDDADWEITQIRVEANVKIDKAVRDYGKFIALEDET